MTRRWRLLPLALAAAAYALAFAQRPGELAADTKIDLHVDPVGFLADAAAAWTPSGGLGQLQTGQYAGYLWPMGPFHALGELIGLAPWVTQRLWLGTLLALAAWGTVRLLDALLERPRGVSQLVAGALVVANPYVVVFANRTSITLLAYALLPWLLLCVQRGLRDSRGWWWPAALALLVTSLGGGVNAAVAAWVLVGPALLIAYEVACRAVPARDALRFLARALPLGLLASAWWLVPVAIQIRFGVDFLPFTESAGAIWGSTSLSESLRLMGFWVTYLGTGYGSTLAPVFGSAPTLLFAPLTVSASLIVPALALAGFAWTRRWRYGPFFLALALIALLVLSTGFPEQAPLRRALTFAYDHVDAVQLMRTTYKAGPLLALALACLAGVAAGELWSRLRGRKGFAVGAAVLGAALIVVAAWPLFSGRAVDAEIAFERVPADWQRTADDIDRELPRGTRALVLPGQVFPYYRWGYVQDPILPALTDRAVAVRGVVPYADLRAVDLLWGTDALIQQRRVLPGQLRQLIGLMGAGRVVVGADDDGDRSGALAPAAATEQLRRGAGLGAPDARHGAVRAYATAGGANAGLVRVQPGAGPLVVDGSAAALAGLAALGALPRERAILYAADLGPEQLRAAARSGAEVVISDSNRRRVFVPSQPRQADGPTLAADEPVPHDGSLLDPFDDRGTTAQTVAVYSGARSLRAPSSPSFPQFPEHRPYAAFDGDQSTWWEADRYLDKDERWIEVDFGRPVDIPELRLLPQRETRTELREVTIGGRRFAIHRRWNRLPLRLRDVRRLRVDITGVDGPPSGARSRGAGAIAELRIPGVRIRERLRPPRLASTALARRDLRHVPLTLLLERTTADDPFSGRRPAGPDSTSIPSGRNQVPSLIARAIDPEAAISRRLDLPAARAYRADGWLTAAPGASAAVLARFAGRGGCVVAARVGVSVLRVRPHGSLRDLRARRSVRAVPCGPPVALPAGTVPLRSPAGPLRMDLLRLRSPAPDPLAPPRAPGRIVDPGDDGRGERDGVRVALTAPAWLVLAESYNRGWRAECDGRDLGEPRPVDGYANGWRAPADCRDVEFRFGPQRVLTAGLALSGLVCLILLAFLLLRAPAALTRSRFEHAVALPIEPLRYRRLSLRHALAVGLAAGLAGGFLFALRAGVVIGPAVALLLWRGVGAGPLALAAGALAGIALPAIYLAFPPEDQGGFNSNYASDLLGAHWVAVAVWVLLALALVRSLPRLRASWRGSRSSM